MTLVAVAIIFMMVVMMLRSMMKVVMLTIMSKMTIPHLLLFPSIVVNVMASMLLIASTV